MPRCLNQGRILAQNEIISKFKPIEVIGPRNWPKSTVIFFHGSNDTGNGLKEWVKHVMKKEWQLKNVKIIYPTAPLRPYSPVRGNLSTVWFDRRQISPFCDEDLESIDAMCNNMKHLIYREVSLGIPYQRIIVGGFSMGGALAMHLAYRFCPSVAGVFALSSFLNEDSVVYKAANEMKERQQKIPPLFTFYGCRDPIVLPEWCKLTLQNLAFSGVDVSNTHKKSDMYHELKKQELLKLEEFILGTFKTKVKKKLKTV